MAANLLPHGTTLHYPGCGCPANWRGQPRLAEAVDTEVQAAVRAMQDGKVVPLRKLNVLYMLPHHNVTGGMKCLVEHLRLLKMRGHRTIAVHRSDKATRAMPPWTSEEADVDVVCKLNQQLQQIYDISSVDVVVVGIFHQVAELLLGLRAPILYWEQGHEWIFGDPVRFQIQHNYLKQDQLFHIVMHLPVALAGVSKAVQAIMQQEFGRSSVLIPNSIDCERFRPGTADENPALRKAPGIMADENTGKPGALQGPSSSKFLPRVLLVGNPSLPLKGFDTALAALEIVNSIMPIHVTWVCQVAPEVSTLPALANTKLSIHYVVRPSQEELPQFYKGHDAFLFTSRYEAWGMPVMEAMASGLAVVTTNCLGVTSFAEPGVNCLLADANDAAMCAQYLLQVLTHQELRENLQKAGRETALKFKPELIVERLETVLYSLVSCRDKLFEIRCKDPKQLEAACIFASNACVPQPLLVKAPELAIPHVDSASSMHSVEIMKQLAGPHIDWQLMQMPLMQTVDFQLLLCQLQQQQQQLLPATTLGALTTGQPILIPSVPLQQNLQLLVRQHPPPQLLPQMPLLNLQPQATAHQLVNLLPQATAQHQLMNLQPQATAHQLPAPDLRNTIHSLARGILPIPPAINPLAQLKLMEPSLPTFPLDTETPSANSKKVTP